VLAVLLIWFVATIVRLCFIVEPWRRDSVINQDQHRDARLAALHEAQAEQRHRLHAASVVPEHRRPQ
jgi:hypothetical protein